MPAVSAYHSSVRINCFVAFVLVGLTALAGSNSVAAPTRGHSVEQQMPYSAILPMLVRDGIESGTRL